MHSAARVIWMVVGAYALICSACALGRVEILISEPNISQSSGACTDFVLFTIEDFTFREGMDLENQIKKLRLTKNRIYDVYRALGTVPEWEIDALEREDALFPARAVIYLRSVSDLDGSVEGIMRLVAGPTNTPYYFNHLFSRRTPDDIVAEIPFFHKYKDHPYEGGTFGDWFKARYPYAHEPGRVVFAPGVNELRVLIDLCGAMTHFSHVLPIHQSHDHFLVVEAVREAQHRYEALGMQAVDIPIRLNDDRVLMVLPMREAYMRQIGNVREAYDLFDRLWMYAPAAAEALLPELEAAVRKVSDVRALQENYSFGLWHLALSHYALNDFTRMAPVVKRLVRINPTSREFRQLELFSETGTRFNFSTGQGNPDAAIAFLESPEAQMRYANQFLAEPQYPFMRHFLKGLVYLGAARYREARETRELITKLLDRHEEEAKQRGRIEWTARPRFMARQQVLTWKHLYFDPETKVGDPHDALHRVTLDEHLNPLPLCPEFHEYRAEVLKALGRRREAAKARAIARALAEE